MLAVISGNDKVNASVDTDNIADITIATGVNILTSYLSVTGNTRHFGQMVILLVVLAKYHQLLYKSTLKAKVNVYEFTRLLPPPKGSGFPPTKPKGFYL